MHFSYDIETYLRQRILVQQVPLFYANNYGYMGLILTVHFQKIYIYSRV